MMRINPELPELMKQNNRQLFRELTDKGLLTGENNPGGKVKGHGAPHFLETLSLSSLLLL